MRAHRTGDFSIKDAYGFEWNSRFFVPEKPPRHFHIGISYYCDLVCYPKLWGAFDLKDNIIELVGGNAFVYQYFTHGAIPESWSGKLGKY